MVIDELAHPNASLIYMNCWCRGCTPDQAKTINRLNVHSGFN
jgi:hypothetical protein